MTKLLILIFLTLVLQSEVFANNNFVRIKLPHNVEIEIPKNWMIISENKRVTIESAAQSQVESILGEYPSNLSFAANYFDDLGKTAAIINIRYYPEIDISQTDARMAGVSEIEGLNSSLYEGALLAAQAAGYSILTWNGTEKREIGNAVIFITNYKRSPIKNNGNFNVYLVRVFDMDQSFTITLSYRENQDVWLKPISEKIIRSLRLEKN